MTLGRSPLSIFCARGTPLPENPESITRCEECDACIATARLLAFAGLSHTVFLKSFCKSRFPHKSVNLFFILVIVKDKLTDMWGS